jgi:Rieske Fe-S protein
LHIFSVGGLFKKYDGLAFTHLKCVVHWNAAEQSWDCPCHGARYSRFGKAINGPASKDLQPPK